jgi:lipid A 3-O-deacylase PagL
MDSAVVRTMRTVCLRSLVLLVLVVVSVLPAMARERRVKIGVELGYAHQHEAYTPGHPASGVQLAIAHLQFIPTLWDRPGKSLRSVELINEIDLMQSVKPNSRFIMGVSEVFRFNFPVSPVWTFYTDFGLGIASSALRIPENNGWMQYQLQGGVGVKKCTGEKQVCLLTQYRYIHLSNNETTKPNRGLNMHGAFVGVNF